LGSYLLFFFLAVIFARRLLSAAYVTTFGAFLGFVRSNFKISGWSVLICHVRIFRRRDPFSISTITSSCFRFAHPIFDLVVGKGDGGFRSGVIHRPAVVGQAAVEIDRGGAEFRGKDLPQTASATLLDSNILLLTI
jgi:hypothetical protein